jgi:Zn-dependent M28 family amino/carboxypeptidase
MNGADDDGSGTVLALEIAEAFAKGRTSPKRSLIFVFHAAEEKGLYGAEYFADHPTVPRDSIVTQINMDQMGRGGAEDAPPAGTNAMVVLGARRLSAELGTIADEVNSRPAYGFTIDRSFDAPGDPSSGWCRSDHYMYARYGIPVLFFVSAVWYIDYHMVSDEPQYIDYPRLAKVGNYIHDVVAEVANLPHRPLLDHARPNPDAACVQ